MRGHTCRGEIFEEESGFTLIEILVVILIIGILAAIVIPSFLNQKSKADNAVAKEQVTAAQLAAETIAVDNNGFYTNVTLSSLESTEPTLKDSSAATLSLAAASTASTFSLKSTDNVTAESFFISKSTSGMVTRTCSPVGRAECPAAGTW